jgi:hypothetical protein
MPALSIRQPHAEQILRGKKKIKYRNMPTNERERVYVYASMTPADQDAWDDIGLEPGDLSTGVIVGCWDTRLLLGLGRWSAVLATGGFYVKARSPVPLNLTLRVW